jgi:hypothetical protein
MRRRRPLWYIPASLAVGVLELLHGIPQARADILRAQAECRWLTCLHGYLDLLDRLHVPVPRQREIIAQVILAPARKRNAGRQALRTGVLGLLESAHKSSHPGAFAKRALQANLRPVKKKIS